MEYKMMNLKKDIHITGLHTFFYYEHPKDFYFAGERHDFWEMVYVDIGEISVVADNTGYIIPQGKAIFHKPMEFHTLASSNKRPHNVMVISFSTNSTAMKFFENKILEMDSQHKKILSNILSEAQKVFGTIPDTLSHRRIKNPEIGAGQLIINYLEQLLIMLIRSGQAGKRSGHVSANAKKNVENAFVELIEQYLLENLDKKIELQDVCDKFNMSKSYICQLFKETAGKSIIDYSINLKITEAKKLIREGKMNFTQISQHLGYTSIHHFSRSFKKVTGLSPSDYIKSVK